jgi:hybrid cluster-associated redox disulfide protein
MSEEHISSDMTITYVLERWPETAKVFHDHNMACVGCAVAPFYAVAEAAVVYGLSPDAFLAELKRAIEKKQQAGEQ